MIPVGAVTVTCIVFGAVNFVEALLDPTDITAGEILVGYDAYNQGQSTMLMNFGQESSSLQLQYQLLVSGTQDDPLPYSAATGYWATHGYADNYDFSYQEDTVFTINSPAWLMVTDDEGHLSGYSATTGAYEMGVPGSRYFEDELGHANIWLPGSPNNYRYFLVGNDRGTVNAYISSALLWTLKDQQGTEHTTFEIIPISLESIPVREGDVYAFKVNFAEAVRQSREAERVGLSLSQGIRFHTTGEWPQDVQAPEITIEGVDLHGRYGSTVTPVISASDDGGQVELTLRLNGAAFSSGQVISEPGSYVLTAVATDSASNRTSLVRNFSILGVPTVRASQVGHPDEEIRLRVSFSPWPGKNHWVESTDNLTTPDWQPLKQGPHNAGFAEAPTTLRGRFYRVRLED
jgi:hypothetical protein